MTRITNVDQVLVLLRSHLERADRSKRPTRSAAPKQRSALERVRDVATDADASDEDIRRALVAGILVEEFGAGFSGDVRFQDLVTSVAKIISDDPQSRQLLDKALDQLARAR